MRVKQRFFRRSSGFLLIALVSLSSLSFADSYKAKSHKNYKGYKGEPAFYKPPVAQACIPFLTLKDGPYVGLSGGYDSYRVHEQITATFPTLAQAANPTINATGLVGGVLAGFGHYFNSALYLGSEVFLNISEAYNSTTYTLQNLGTGDVIVNNAKFFVTTGYGIHLLPGVKLNDAGLLYVRLGYNVARLRGQMDITVDGNLNVANTSSWSGGFGYGIGFEEAMVENFSLRGEYMHIDYRTFSDTFGTQYSASNNQFQVSLIYHI